MKYNVEVASPHSEAEKTDLEQAVRQALNCDPELANFAAHWSICTDLGGPKGPQVGLGGPEGPHIYLCGPLGPRY